MGLFGDSKKSEAVFAKVEQQLRIPATFNDTFDIRIVRIDGCQYLVGTIGYTYVAGISTIIHKADCDNPEHKKQSESNSASTQAPIGVNSSLAHSHRDHMDDS